MKKQKLLTSGQQTALDLYRIIAAYFVLLGHTFSIYDLTVFRNQLHFPYLQNIGTVMLLLLSGFLLLCSLNNKSDDVHYGIKQFCAHRLKRIMREYIPGLLVVLLIDEIYIYLCPTRYMNYERYSIKCFFGNLLLLQGMGIDVPFLGEIMPFGSAKPLWTLPVIWWFSMLIGAIFFIVRKKRPISYSILLAIISLTLWIYFVLSKGIAVVGFLVIMGIGCTIYFLYDRINGGFANLLFGISLIVYIFYEMQRKETYTLVAFFLIGLILLAYTGMAKNAKNRERNALIKFLSGSTFLLYIIHYPILELVHDCIVIDSNHLKAIISVALSIILSITIYGFCVLCRIKTQ